jgi:hypothetical protein
MINQFNTLINNISNGFKLNQYKIAIYSALNKFNISFNMELIAKQICNHLVMKKFFYIHLSCLIWS